MAQVLWSVAAGAVELRNSVMSKFGIDLPATVTFDYPSIAALAGYVVSRTGPRQAAARPKGLAGSLVAAALTAGSGRRATITEVVGISSAVAASGDLDAGQQSAWIPGFMLCHKKARHTLQLPFWGLLVI